MASREFEWVSGETTLRFTQGSDAPVQWTGFCLDGGPSAIRAHALVDVFTAVEQRERSSQAFLGSAIGERLRYLSHAVDDSGLEIRQLDEAGGIEVVSHLMTAGAAGVQWSHTIRNVGTKTVTLTAASSLTLQLAEADDVRLLSAASDWLAEGRWRESTLADVLPDRALHAHGQAGRARFAVSSHGSWSSGEHLPMGVLARASGPSIAWQIETSAGWCWELSQTEASVVLAAAGPGDLEHQFAEHLEPGRSFTTVPAGVVIANGDRDAALAALTRYRRAVRRERPVDRTLPVVYNDYMNTLMGQPSTEALLPLIDAAADAGAEVFCIDAGWFTDATEYWSAIGVWEEAPTRFTGGLAAVIDAIHARGMRSGLWLEPEIVGVDSPAAKSLPDEAFFHRFGERVTEARRHHLDLRHPAARAHLDESIDRLVREFGVSYFKLDYNINAGAGTDLDAAGAGAGLLGHTRALRSWLEDVQERHPDVLIENCASGAMRADQALLSVTHLQSTSDQQDAARLAPIVASAPAGILPEQCGNWAYPAASMSDGETALTLVNGLAGRLMLSGFLPELRSTQLDLVGEAFALHRQWRPLLVDAVPEWPLGLPGWEDDVCALVLHAGEQTLVCLWSRGDRQHVTLPGLGREVRSAFPARAPGWEIARDGDDLVVAVPEGPDARALLI
ncbi:glycoside hydrolase family 36 protein [Microbacterium sp. NPDC058342]|uniref:glycoside hydrolase family 36 protein n=1 Tax=Microbacterium sp. NPDC058342 TaxID=3346454 RepID=UPI003660EC78